MNRKVLYYTCITQPFFFITFFALSIPAVADSNSNFAHIKLPRGIELQIPKDWRLLGDDHNRIIQILVEADMDLSGIGLPDGQKTNLIALNSMPRSTYASVRVDSTIPPSVSPSELALVTTADIREMQNVMRQNIEKKLSLLGGQLIEYFGFRIEKISGHPSIVTEYRRTGLKGPVFVQINQIFTSNQEIIINLSYRESEVVLWKDVIGKIRQSIVIK